MSLYHIMRIDCSEFTAKYVKFLLPKSVKILEILNFGYFHWIAEFITAKPVKDEDWEMRTFYYFRYGYEFEFPDNFEYIGKVNDMYLFEKSE
jgi:hypothetical protein